MQQMKSPGRDTLLTPQWALALKVATLAAIALVGIALLAYAYNGHYTRFWADDYCHAGKVRGLGLWGAQVSWYETWTGRFTYTFFTDVAVWLGQGAAPYVIIAISVFVLGAIVLAVSQINRLLLGSTYFVGTWLVAVVMLFAFITAAPNRIQTVFWISGSINYLMPLGFICLYAALLAWRLTTLRTPQIGWVTAGAFLLMLIGAGFAETYLVWQTCLAGAIVVLSWAFAKGEARRLLLPMTGAGFAGSLIGGVIVYVAPGNDTRDRDIRGGMGIAEALQNSIQDSAPAMLDFFTTPSIVACAAAAFFVTYVFVRTARAPQTEWRSLIIGGAIGLGLCFLLIVATYFPSYYKLGNEPEERSLASAEFTAMATLAYLGYVGARLLWLFQTSERFPDSPQLSKLPLAWTLVGLMLLGVATVPITRAEIERRDELSSIVAASDRRDDQIRQAVAEGRPFVQVSVVRRGGGLIDLSRDANYWFNNCIARYHDIGQVRTRN